MSERITLEMDPLNPVRWTPYGFGWGPALVTRMWSFARMDHGKLRERFCFAIDTGQVIPNEKDGAKIDAPKHRLHVYVSGQGRRVHVYLDGEKMVRESLAKGLLTDLDEAYQESRRLRRECGSFGCTLPRGHNTGKVDIPANHRPARRTR